MRFTIRNLTTVTALFFALLMASGDAQASWPSSSGTSGNLAVSASTSWGPPAIVEDGLGGVIVAWVAGVGVGGAGDSIRVQRISPSGSRQWGSDGVVVTGNPYACLYPVICSDGAGGAIIAWVDGRATYSLAYYAQRVSSSGSMMWAANGIQLDATLDVNGAGYPAIVADGLGGAVVTWPDGRNGGTSIYAQKITSAGTLAWLTDVCDGASTHLDQQIVSDGANGAIISWTDSRNGPWDVYAQRLSASGANMWTASGVLLCNAPGSQLTTKLCADGVGGAVVAWSDYRSGPQNIYAQRISSAGTLQWGASGAAVETATDGQGLGGICSDAAGGAIVTWTERRYDSNSDVFAQRISATSSLLWQADGVPVCTATHDQSYPTATPDGNGGALIRWEDGRVGPPNTPDYDDVYAKRLDAFGTNLWNVKDGVALSTAAGAQRYAVACSDGAGGLIVAWEDDRSTIPLIYAQRIGAFGYLGAEPTITSIIDVPNDQGGFVTVQWSGSWLDTSSSLNFSAYDVYRSSPTTAPTAGARRRSPAAPPHVAKLTSALPPSVVTQSYAWQYVGTVNATRASSYSLVAATTIDSVIGGSNPRTSFLVVGRNGDGTAYWLSPPDSGYSVDNIAPATVAQFSAASVSGVVTLTWAQNTEADFASYRLYRGTTSTFVPGPSNLLVEKQTTGYVDTPGAASYYKITAVDSHGNIAPYATVSSSGSGGGGGGGGDGGGGGGTGTSDPGASTPLALTVRATHGGVVQIRWSLPQAGDVAVTVHDIAGRRVRELVAGAATAGAHSTQWDGRDASGTAVAAGVYLVRLAAGHQVLNARVLRMP